MTGPFERPDGPRNGKNPSAEATRRPLSGGFGRTAGAPPPRRRHKTSDPGTGRPLAFTTEQAKQRELHTAHLLRRRNGAV